MNQSMQNFFSIASTTITTFKLVLMRKAPTHWAATYFSDELYSSLLASCWEGLLGVNELTASISHDAFFVLLIIKGKLVETKLHFHYLVSSIIESKVEITFSGVVACLILQPYQGGLGHHLISF